MLKQFSAISVTTLDYIISNSPSVRRKVEDAYSDYLKEGGVSLDAVIKKLGKKKVAKKSSTLISPSAF